MALTSAPRRLCQQAVQISRRSAASCLSSSARAPQRCLHSAVRASQSRLLSPSSASARRPTQVFAWGEAHPTRGRRTLFIQTESTPNADALKFKPNCRVLPEDFQSSFLEYLSPRSTLSPPNPSPLAAQLFNVEGVTSIFYGADHITVTKDSGTPWGHVKPEIFSLITEAVTAGKPFVNTVERTSADEEGQGGMERDSLEYDENDSEVVSMIKELLETRIRPAIQEDGGDIEFRGFHNGWVRLKLRGACRTCDSSTVTLRNGIESMLQHYIQEVQGVEQVLDQEEEIAMKEFAKFEEKLAKAREVQPPPAAAS